MFCSVDGKQKSYCTPEAYRGTTTWLFRNRRDGTFEDVTAKAGLFDATSKSLGVTLLDYDLDVWPDLFVANDTQPNKLYRNNGNGTFTELGLQAGLAFSEEGRARAGMGVDAADVDNTGRTSVVVTNFSGEMLGLYKPVGGGQYSDVSPRSDIGRATRHTLGFGCFFFDADLDGLQDLLVVNGHIDDTISRVQARVTYAEAPHLFRNVGDARFEDVAAAMGGAFAQPKVGRGAAFGDFDGDGDPDVVITSNGGPAFLYRNDVLNGNRVIRFTLRGTKSNRDAIGAKVRRHSGRAALLEDGQDRIQLPVAIGAAALLRPGHEGGGRPRGDRVAERRARGADVARGRRELCSRRGQRHRGEDAARDSLTWCPLSIVGYPLPGGRRTCSSEHIAEAGARGRNEMTRSNGRRLTENGPHAPCPRTRHRRPRRPRRRAAVAHAAPAADLGGHRGTRSPRLRSRNRRR